MASKEPSNRKLARRGSFRKELKDAMLANVIGDDAMAKTRRRGKSNKLLDFPLTKNEAKVAKGARKGKVKLGGMEFTEVPPPKGYSSSAQALFSPKGMNPDELGAFAGKVAAQFLPRKEPHLIDLILDGGLFNPEAAPPLSTLHQAKKFIFDAGASEYIGSLLMAAQPEVLSQHQWARPPFDVTWIEMDHAAYWERGLGMPNDVLKGTPDNLFGMLVDHATVWLFSHAPGGYSGASLGCGPFMYRLHTPITFEEEMEMARRHGISLEQYRQALLGGMIDNETGKTIILPEWWHTMAGEIVRSHRMIINPAIKGIMDKATPENRFQALASGAGDLKLIITLLLMVTRPRKMFNVSETGPKRMLYKGHNLVRRAHSVVTMRLAKEAAIKHAVHHEFTSQHRQMHDVRGHWAQVRNAPGLCHASEHAWEPLDKDHFYCLNCPAKRWWRKAHTRGELRLGDKTTDYHVTD